MAYQIKYRCEFTDMGSGTTGIDWKVEILQDPWAGAVTDLVATGDPLNFEWNNESDDVFDSIKASKAILTVWCETSFALTDLYSTEDLKFKVNIYQDTVLYWSGYIITDNYSEPYIDVPYPVTIIASCGLTQLRSILYDDSGTPYNGRTLESQIIIDILGKIGYTGFTEYVNIYEERMDVTTDDSPMDQNKIDVDIFQDMYCDKVLNEVLKKYDACIIHKVGGFVIYRPSELTGATVYGRIFTAATTKSSTSFTSVKYINRLFHVSTINQVPGGVMMIQSPAKKVNINQDFGNKESLIDTWEFNGDAFDGTDFEDWTRSASTVLTTIKKSISDNNNGVTIDNYDTTAPYAYYIYQDFIPDVKQTTDACVFEFDYLLYNNTNADITGVYFGVSLSQATAWLLLDGSWSADPGDKWLLRSSVTAVAGSAGWQHMRIDVNNSPNNIVSDSVALTVVLGCANNASVRVSYKDVKFYFASEEISRIKSKKKGRLQISGGYGGYWQISRAPIYITTRTLKELQITEETYNPVITLTGGKELDYDYMLGDVTDVDVNIDNIIEQFGGSLAVVKVRIDTLTLTGTSGNAQITCNGLTKYIAYYGGSLTATAAAFVTTWYDAYLATGVIVSSSGVDIIFTGSPAADFSTDTIIVPTGGDLDGSVVITQAFELLYATDWNTRSPGGESKELLKIIGDEIAAQYGRPKQLVQMAIKDTGSAVSAIDLISHYIDPLNSEFNAISVGMSGGNLIYTLYNVITGDPYTTFTFTGTAITSAVQTAAAASQATGLHSFIIADEVILRVQFTLTLNSGELPYFSIYSHIAGTDVSNVVQASAGVNDFELIMTSAVTDGVLYIHNTEETDFETTEIFIGNKPRKFVFNRGEFSAKFRKWMIDLCEIID